MSGAQINVDGKASCDNKAKEIGSHKKIGRYEINNEYFF